MKTVIVELYNPKAFTLLKELEELQLLKIINETITEKKIKISEKYKNVFTKKDAEKFENHTKTLRKEWDSI